MLYVTAFEIDQNKTFQNAVIKNKIDLICSSIYGKLLLSANISEAFSEFKKEKAQIVKQCLLQVTFFVNGKLWKTCKFKDIGFFQNIFRAFDDFSPSFDNRITSSLSVLSARR